MTMAQLQAQSLWVLGLSFGMAAVWGVVLHRSHFCTMGAISDVLIMGSSTRLRQWVLAVALSVLGFGLMTAMGWISPLNTIYGGTPLNGLTLVLGGVLFGVGMVLASGCTSKNLVRLAGGNLKALVVLISMGIFALATMRGLPGVFRVQVLDKVALDMASPFAGQWLSALTGWPLNMGVVTTSALVALALLVWIFKDRDFRQTAQWWPGLASAMVVLVVWWLSGVVGFVPEHPETLEAVFLTSASGRMESLSFTAPMAYTLDAFMYFSDGSKRVNLGMALAAGVLLGAWASAWQQGSLRWEGFTRISDLSLHLLGGALMGVGAVMAMGCSVGQGLSGLSTLSWASMLAVAGIVLGAVLTLQWQIRRAQASS
ncbi:MAG: transporter [Comamonadaceae bacterium PBBC2]|nr:MAG: transporter [Comamonadaceae bacterium PBBC2]